MKPDSPDPNEEPLTIDFGQTECQGDLSFGLFIFAVMNSVEILFAQYCNKAGGDGDLPVLNIYGFPLLTNRRREDLAV
jgi:hypothetical protein